MMMIMNDDDGSYNSWSDDQSDMIFPLEDHYGCRQRHHSAATETEEAIEDDDDYDASGSDADDDLSNLEELTVDSLILTRLRFAKNRLDKCIPSFLRGDTKRRRRRRLTRHFSGDIDDIGLESIVLEQVRESLTGFVEEANRKRRTIKKHDSLELAKERNPTMVHNEDQEEEVTEDQNDGEIRTSKGLLVHRDSLELTRKRLPHLICIRDDDPRIPRLMRTRDSFELARERLPHLVIVRDNDDEEVPDLTQIESDEWLSDDVSYLNDDDEEEVSSVNSDSDYDPFASEIDSLVLTRRRLPKLIHRRKPVSSTTVKKDFAPHKDLGFDRVGLNDDLLQSARPNSGGAIAA